MIRGTRVWHTTPEAWEKLKPLARQKRSIPTHTEEKLWKCLRNRQLSGFKFRRQYSIERFIVDFFCAEVGLVVEIDGPIHDYQREEDNIRENYIKSQGMMMLRFSNEEVTNNISSVLHRISKVLSQNRR